MMDESTQRPAKSGSGTPLKNKKKLIAIVGCVAAAVLVLVVVGSLFIVRIADETHKKNGPTKFSSLASISDGVQPRLRGDVLTTTASNGPWGMTNDGLAAYTLPPYGVKEQYQTLPAQGVGLGMRADATTSASNYQTLKDYFAEHHFTLLDSQKGKMLPEFLSRPYDVSVKAYALYEAPATRCVIWRMDVSHVLPDENITSVGCADTAQYKKVADFVKPLYEAYRKSGAPAATDGLVFGPSVVRDGADGYKSVTVYQEDPGQVESDKDTVFFTGMYYKAPDAKDWKYFTGARGVVVCSAYHSDVMKKAFRGLDCYDDATKRGSLVEAAG